MSEKQQPVKIIPLGGLYEVGKNMTAIEYNDEIIIIDCGMTFPEEEMLGIDIVIPDISYLLKNEHKVKGILISHGHEDHIGSLPYFIKKINTPIYGTKLTLGLVENKFKEHNIKNANLNKIDSSKSIKIGQYEVEFIRTVHSIPGSVAIAIHTPVGTIVYTGDFKIDFTPIDGKGTDFSKLIQLGDKGVLVLMADSTNVERPGYTMSEKNVGNTFNNIFRTSKQRIIVATFASNVYRVQQIINSAVLFDRKVVASGRSMVNVIGVASELGYLDIPEGTLIDIKNMKDYPSDKIVVITTGSQGEPMSALVRIASSNHRQVELMPDDLVIISATPIPGNEKTVSNVINQLLEKGAEVIYQALADIHVSGHACQEELKLMHTLLKPKYFIPVHGEYRHLKRHSELAQELGMSKEHIFIAKNGSVVEFTSNSGKISGSVTSGNILVDGLGVGDVGTMVLKDRRHLSNDGLIVVVASINKEDKSIVRNPYIVSRGFVYVKESEDLMEEAKEVVKNALIECEKRNITEWSTLKSNIRVSLRDFLYKKTQREPMILPIIMEV